MLKGIELVRPCMDQGRARLYPKIPDVMQCFNKRFCKYKMPWSMEKTKHPFVVCSRAYHDDSIVPIPEPIITKKVRRRK